MSNTLIKKCPKCGQKLRFPSDIGGLVMVCPSCGKKFYSDFKIRGAKSQPPRVMKEEDDPLQSKSQGVLRWMYDKCFCFWFK